MTVLISRRSSASSQVANYPPERDERRDTGRCGSNDDHRGRGGQKRGRERRRSRLERAATIGCIDCGGLKRQSTQTLSPESRVSRVSLVFRVVCCEMFFLRWWEDTQTGRLGGRRTTDGTTDRTGQIRKGSGVWVIACCGSLLPLLGPPFRDFSQARQRTARQR